MFKSTWPGRLPINSGTVYLTTMSRFRAYCNPLLAREVEGGVIRALNFKYCRYWIMETFELPLSIPLSMLSPLFEISEREDNAKVTMSLSFAYVPFTDPLIYHGLRMLIPQSISSGPHCVISQLSTHMTRRTFAPQAKAAEDPAKDHGGQPSHGYQFSHRRG